jgi:hypothetical protein
MSYPDDKVSLRFSFLGSQIGSDLYSRFVLVFVKRVDSQSVMYSSNGFALHFFADIRRLRDPRVYLWIPWAGTKKKEVSLRFSFLGSQIGSDLYSCFVVFVKRVDSQSRIRQMGSLSIFLPIFVACVIPEFTCAFHELERRSDPSH